MSTNTNQATATLSAKDRGLRIARRAAFWIVLSLATLVGVDMLAGPSSNGIPDLVSSAISNCEVCEAAGSAFGGSDSQAFAIKGDKRNKLVLPTDADPSDFGWTCEPAKRSSGK